MLLREDARIGANLLGWDPGMIEKIDTIILRSLIETVCDQSVNPQTPRAQETTNRIVEKLLGLEE